MSAHNGRIASSTRAVRVRPAVVTWPCASDRPGPGHRPGRAGAMTEGNSCIRCVRYQTIIARKSS